MAKSYSPSVTEHSDGVQKLCWIILYHNFKLWSMKNPPWMGIRSDSYAPFISFHSRSLSSSSFECSTPDLSGRFFVVILSSHMTFFVPHTCHPLSLIQSFHLACQSFSFFKFYPTEVEGSLYLMNTRYKRIIVSPEYQDTEPSVPR